MKFILAGIVGLALAVGAGTESGAVRGAADNPAAGGKREFRVVFVGLAELKRRIVDAEADVAMWKERVAWTARFVRKCFPREMLEADRTRLESAEIALEKLRQALQKFPVQRSGR